MLSFTVYDAGTFAQAFAAVNGDMNEAGGFYTITVTGSFAASPVILQAGNKTVTLKGDGIMRTISNTGSGRLCSMSPGITLILDSNITLNGNGQSYPLVAVNTGATLMMKSGAVIRGAKESGVSVTGGSFTMSGGEISGNTASSSSYGGGVYVEGSASFIKQDGGTIDAANSATKGKVAYVSGSKKRDTAAGPSVNLNSSVAGVLGGWE